MKPNNNQENISLCICGKCPVFNDCNREKSEILFCAREKTDCSMDNKKMCICGMCKVYGDNGLTGGYFCINEISN